MRGTRLPIMPSRIKGRASLLRRLHRLRIAAERYAQGRARTPTEVLWTCRLIDGVDDLLVRLDPAAPRRDRLIGGGESL